MLRFIERTCPRAPPRRKPFIIFSIPLSRAGDSLGGVQVAGGVGAGQSLRPLQGNVESLMRSPSAWHRTGLALSANDRIDVLIEDDEEVLLA